MWDCSDCFLKVYSDLSQEVGRQRDSNVALAEQRTVLAATPYMNREGFPVRLQMCVYEANAVQAKAKAWARLP
jgi:hypothetical protein